MRQVNPVWLFPITYALHLCEEYALGGGFPLWAERTLGVHFSDADFIAWNAFGLGVMCVGAWLVNRNSRFHFIEVALAIALLGNVMAHALGSVLTWTYSPGLITAVVLWTPLSVVRFRNAYAVVGRRARLAALCVGVVVVLVQLVVVGIG
jgi:hypothetical protein